MSHWALSDIPRGADGAAWMLLPLAHSPGQEWEPNQLFFFPLCLFCLAVEWKQGGPFASSLSGWIKTIC